MSRVARRILAPRTISVDIIVNIAVDMDSILL